MGGNLSELINGEVPVNMLLPLGLGASPTGLRKQVGDPKTLLLAVSARRAVRAQGSRLRVVFVSTEVAPWSKAGGLGEVLSSLPAALASRGHRVITVSPRYHCYEDALDTGMHAPVQVTSGDKKLHITITGEEPIEDCVADVEWVKLYKATKDGVDNTFVNHPLFQLGNHCQGPNAGVYTYSGAVSHGDVQARSSILCQAALAAPILMWQEPYELAALLQQQGSALTISNGVVLPSLTRHVGGQTYAKGPLSSLQILRQRLASLETTEGGGAASIVATSTTGASAFCPSEVHLALDESHYSPVIFVGNDWPSGVLPLWLETYREVGNSPSTDDLAAQRDGGVVSVFHTTDDLPAQRDGGVVSISRSTDDRAAGQRDREVSKSPSTDFPPAQRNGGVVGMSHTTDDLAAGQKDKGVVGISHTTDDPAAQRDGGVSTSSEWPVPSTNSESMLAKPILQGGRQDVHVYDAADTVIWNALLSMSTSLSHAIDEILSEPLEDQEGASSSKHGIPNKTNQSTNAVNLSKGMMTQLHDGNIASSVAKTDATAVFVADSVATAVSFEGLGESSWDKHCSDEKASGSVMPITDGVSNSVAAAVSFEGSQALPGAHGGFGRSSSDKHYSDEKASGIHASDADSNPGEQQPVHSRLWG
eukprot:gene23235-30459_t